MGSLLAFAFMLGLVIGSFGNVLLTRLKTGESLGGRSHCPRCRRTIPWYDLVPILSYLILRARCRACRKRISIQYPLIELGCGVLFMVGFLSTGDVLSALALSLLLTVLFLTAIFDLLHQQIPDAASMAIAVLGFGLSVHAGSAVPAVIGATIALVWFGGQWVASRGRWVGTGDIFLAAALGLWLRTPGTVTMIALSYMVGALVAIFLLVTGLIARNTKRLPFAPLLAAGAILAWCGVGDWYLRLIGW